MRKQLYLFTLLFCSFFFTDLSAQVKVVNDGILTIKDNQLFHINGDFSNYSSSLLNNGRFNLTGNLINEVPVFNPGTGLFRFIGIDQQELMLFDTTRMYNIEISNFEGLLFSGSSNLEVFGNLDFQEGIAFTSPGSMFSFQNNASSSNAYTFSHINGPALKTGIDDFVFPLGKEGFYRPAAISELASSGSFQMEYFHDPYFNDIKDFNVKKVNEEGYWDLKSINSVDFPKLSLNYDQSSNMFEDLSNIQIVHWKDQWEVVPSLSDGAAPLYGITTEDFLADFGFFTTAEKLKFKAEIIDFNVFPDEECTVNVSWTMAPGSFVGTYEVEVSFDSLEFASLGKVAGDSIPISTYHTYTFLDENIYSESKLFYRLKMIAPGGDSTYFTYSTVAVYDNPCIFSDCILFPNPVPSGADLYLQMDSEEAMEMPITIWDELGHLLLEQTLNVEVGPQVYKINTKQMLLPSAVYFLKVTKRKTLKFVVIND